ncbi:MFS transporter [Gryllotalpicola ginsengisoli]|uniref:MFS transporter n=1 Tax=Gryllotalpicola ginsengisoli TaxID=444608 RepID=UPI001FE05CB9|nr:MFS transporter [Gryllotalpicola ginsengisoli]
MSTVPAAPPEVKIPTRKVLAWGAWDWGSSAFNAVATTFVFTVYLTGKSFGDTDHTSALLGWALGVAGVLVALTAPATGELTDAAGRRKLWLAVFSALVALCLLATVFVKAEPGYLWLGIGAVAVGTIFYELAAVNYNAMLTQVSTPKTIGKVSGLGWGLGYVGGIVLLLIVYVGFISGDGGLFHVSTDGGWNVRVSMLVATVWFAVFAVPVLLAVHENRAPAAVARERSSFFGAYATLFRTIRGLWQESRNTVWFLLASAIFRDGLTGVFTFGGVLAAGSFGFSSGGVIVFAIAANIVAGVATIATGALDDRLGPKPVIVTSLIGLVIAGALVFLLHDGGQIMFWIFGLILCLFVGPAQSASRTFLARLIPEGREGEVFGLYATTGRAATFLAPTAFALFVDLGGKQIYGVIGIVLVLLIGLLVMLPVKPGGAKLAGRQPV